MKKWNVAAVRAAKGAEKLGCCTAYDACFARLADEAGVPIILVGDMPFGSYQCGEDAAVAIIKQGADAMTLECIPSELAAEITAAVRIPTIGIGAGPVCDAQWLVMHDLLGLNEKVPSFVKKYADLAGTVRSAFAAYVGEVKSGTFPG